MFTSPSSSKKTTLNNRRLYLKQFPTVSVKPGMGPSVRNIYFEKKKKKYSNARYIYRVYIIVISVLKRRNKIAKTLMTNANQISMRVCLLVSLYM